MKRILSVCLLALTVTACHRKEVAPDAYIKPLHLSVEPTSNGLSLSWGPVFIFEEGMYPGPTPVAPAQYEIYVSETNGNSLQKVATIDGAVQQYTLTNQPEGKTLYAQVKAIHPALTGSQSPIVTTNVGTLGNTNVLFPNSTPLVTFGSWSGSTLLYSSSLNTWVIQSTDGATRTLKQEGSYPLLSPDGRSIAYLSTVNTNTSYTTQLFVKNLESGATRLLETKQAIFSLEWSSDSQSIAFMAFNLESNAGTGVWLRKISEDTSVPLYIPSVGLNQLRTDQLDWSPDGQSVVVSLEIPLQGQVGTQLLKIPIGGGSSQAILASNWQDRYPTYSPDGTRLAFISTRSGYPAIWLYELQTGKLRQLTGVGEGFYYVNRLDWRNNRQLTYTAQLPTSGSTSLKVVTLPN
ncbi:PD40 domain-containing protein [Spirosoma linguale]|uniref:Fibronectin type III domain protein n=1 Tax=Spirosoma linguale (strain ATCC 33905 / DSM 74 / LMG 10896 / Claus 1) TaxID=504472 RepID=D2QN64_SPILD|nr:Fibronectin type III domain protein [Spirosoma linguale DSM 74]